MKQIAEYLSMIVLSCMIALCFYKCTEESSNTDSIVDQCYEFWSQVHNKAELRETRIIGDVGHFLALIDGSCAVNCGHKGKYLPATDCIDTIGTVEYESRNLGNDVLTLIAKINQTSSSVTYVYSHDGMPLNTTDFSYFGTCSGGNAPDLLDCFYYRIIVPTNADCKDIGHKLGHYGICSN